MARKDAKGLAARMRKKIVNAPTFSYTEDEKSRCIAMEYDYRLGSLPSNKVQLMKDLRAKINGEAGINK